MEETLQTAPNADENTTQEATVQAQPAQPAEQDVQNAAVTQQPAEVQEQNAAEQPALQDQAQESATQPAQDEPRAEAQTEAQPQANNEDTFLLDSGEAKQIIENLLFITDRPLKPSRIAEVVETVNAKRVLEIIQELAKEYEDTGRSIRILEIGGGYQMCTKPEYGRWVRRLYNEKMTTRLSNAALETLAIIAYKQPVTRAEMEMIRGVDVAAPLEKLLERGLVRVLGKRDTIGRPMVYGTTDEFLRLFGLNKISELPDLQIFAAKQLQEKQEDLPFDEKLPPLGEPAILALEEETQDAADAFFKRPKNMFEPEEETPAQPQPEAAPQQETEEPLTPAAAQEDEPAAQAQQPETDGTQGEKQEQEEENA